MYVPSSIYILRCVFMCRSSSCGGERKWLAGWLAAAMYVATQNRMQISHRFCNQRQIMAFAAWACTTVDLRWQWVRINTHTRVKNAQMPHFDYTTYHTQTAIVNENNIYHFAAEPLITLRALWSFVKCSSLENTLVLKGPGSRLVFCFNTIMHIRKKIVKAEKLNQNIF